MRNLTFTLLVSILLFGSCATLRRPSCSGQRIAQLLEEFNDFLDAEDWNNARKKARRLLRLDRVNTVYHYYTLGVIAMQKQETNRAKRYFNRAIAHCRNSDIGYFGMGMLYINLGADIIENARNLERATGTYLPNEEWEVLMTKRLEYERKALSYLERGLEMSQDLALYGRLLRDVYWALGSRDPLMRDKHDEMDQRVRAEIGTLIRPLNPFRNFKHPVICEN